MLNMYSSLRESGHQILFTKNDARRPIAIDFAGLGLSEASATPRIIKKLPINSRHSLIGYPGRSSWGRRGSTWTLCLCRRGNCPCDRIARAGMGTASNCA
ncbi:hypothetical protein CEXT_705591 [Caerostris extrusa]|uniref:Uncharacterized protein n=1 Tax=Caerostris extrusa TaxID=172846 RepID=A0AAV4Q4B3_CAEEX|nr:hypothetical protein CEXT_705591 [Caerostris extrusa]